MDYCQTLLKVPNNNTCLIRYMSEWKFDSFFDVGIPFTSIKKQIDKREGIIDGKRTGYTHFINDSNFLENNYISCWSIEDVPNFKKFEKYACWQNQDGSENQLAFAIKISFDNLKSYATSCCNLINGSYHYESVHNLYFGEVKYKGDPDYQEYDLHTQEGSINHLFQKDAEYKWEQEFRLVLTQTSYEAIYNEHENNYMIDSDPSQFIPLSTFPEPIFPCEIFIFNHSGNHISKTFYDLRPIKIAEIIKKLHMKSKCRLIK